MGSKISRPNQSPTMTHSPRIVRTSPLQEHAPLSSSPLIPRLNQQQGLSLSPSSPRTPRSARRQNPKLVLFGTKSSGKSTILKQLSILSSSGFGEKEKAHYKKLIEEFMMNTLQLLISKVDRDNLCDESLELVEMIEQMSTEEDFFSFDSDVASGVSQLWNDRIIKEVFYREMKGGSYSNAEYFFNNALDFGNWNYEVNEQDILYVKNPSESIKRSDFEIYRSEVEVITIGQMKSGRDAFSPVNYLHSATGLVFVASLSDFDQVSKPNQTNKMSRSASLFKSILTNKLLPSTVPIILLFNKMDLFKQKLKTVNLQHFFPLYQGGNSRRKAYKFITDLYLSDLLQM
eukprot:TRINITY_DN11349_c0_g1_i1.p1 TRINITY_DN11349_c0_g1~~TRINITY_DN11349_c0_g1_i1.p1  ORF type:complete len:345 (-),score=57.47 TRINITY_DN11349_c0_g1_i1:151-1185(-)